MKTEWDYSELAEAYLKRPPYAAEALERIFETAGLERGDHVCDIGAGVGHLTLPLLEAGFRVTAVEPNDAMRANGMKQTAGHSGITWVEAGGEDTGQPSGAFDFVSFGSSFNVMDRQKALAETRRLLKPGRWFACLWNHRDLDDPIQKGIEEVIHAHIPGYDYGTRREDQRGEIEKSGLFGDVRYIEGRYVCRQSMAEAIEAWSSHATLSRQAGGSPRGGGVSLVVEKIRDFLLSLNQDQVDIPYITRAWAARSPG